MGIILDRARANKFEMEIIWGRSELSQFTTVPQGLGYLGRFYNYALASEKGDNFRCVATLDCNFLHDLYFSPDKWIGHQTRHNRKLYIRISSRVKKL